MEPRTVRTVKRGQQNAPCAGCNSPSCFKKNCGVEMKIKTSKVTTRHELDTSNSMRVTTSLAKKLGDTPFHPLLQLIAEALDSAGQDEGTWLSIGCSQDKTAYLLCVHYKGQKMYAGGASLEDMSTDCQNLLETS